MLRPQTVVSWTKERAEKGRPDIHQLLEGLMIGGQIVIGGAEKNVIKALSLTGGLARAGRLVSIQHAELDPTQTTTFDAMAVSQLIMTAKNEGFHEASEAFANMLEQMHKDGHSVGLILRTFREKVDSIPKL